MSRVIVHQWREAEFASGRDCWQSLLCRSSADRLFNSWDWQRLWWSRYGITQNLQLFLLAVVSEDDGLIGLAPLYLRSSPVLRVLPGMRLECLGSKWRDSGVAFSEYFDLVAEARHEHVVIESLATWLGNNASWSDWAVPFVKQGSIAHRLAQRLGSTYGIREVEALDARVLALHAGFEAVLAKLSPNTRRRFWAHRRRLDRPTLRVASEADIEPLLSRMHAWRTARWGSLAAGPDVHAFELEVARSFASRGCLQLTQLESGGRPISIMINLRVGDTEYYIASAFDPAAASGISPGYLHFGYAIEAACQAGVRRFDLLAGNGRHRDYKLDLRPQAEMLVSLHVLRAPWLRALHCLNRLRLRTEPVT